MQLVRYDAARHALSIAHSVDEVKEIRDKAQAMAAYARQAKDTELVEWATEIKVRAERKAGEMLRDMDLRPGRPEKNTDTLSALGIQHHQSSRWQKLAAVSDDRFEEAVAAAKQVAGEVTTAALIRLAGEDKKVARSAEIERQKVALAEAQPNAPLGLFHVIAIDPPWPYDDGVSQAPYDPQGHRASNPYPELPLAEISALRIPAAEDCVLWLWTTHKFMRHAFPLLDAWGFTERAIVTWAKDRMGLGRWLRSQSEFCIMATRGSPVINLTNQTTLLNGPMREHSRKPDEFYALVGSLCVGRKLDYFSRELREGWEQFGNDTQRFAVG